MTMRQTAIWWGGVVKTIDLRSLPYNVERAVLEIAGDPEKRRLLAGLVLRAREPLHEARKLAKRWMRSVRNIERAVVYLYGVELAERGIRP